MADSYSRAFQKNSQKLPCESQRDVPTVGRWVTPTAAHVAGSCETIGDNNYTVQPSEASKWGQVFLDGCSALETLCEHYEDAKGSKDFPSVERVATKTLNKIALSLRRLMKCVPSSEAQSPLLLSKELYKSLNARLEDILGLLRDDAPFAMNSVVPYQSLQTEREWNTVNREDVSMPRGPSTLHLPHATSMEDFDMEKEGANVEMLRETVQPGRWTPRGNVAPTAKDASDGHVYFRQVLQRIVELLCKRITACSPARYLESLPPPLLVPDFVTLFRQQRRFELCLSNLISQMNSGEGATELGMQKNKRVLIEGMKLMISVIKDAGTQKGDVSSAEAFMMMQVICVWGSSD